MFSVVFTHARSKIFNFFHSLNSSLIKMVYYVRLKSISLNCFDILTQEMIFSRNDSSLFGL